MSDNRVLVIAAHPDDEILGCGGTIAWHVSHGHEVFVLILAEGITSRSNNRNEKQWQSELNQLKDSAYIASGIVGAQLIDLHTFPDNRMDSCDLLDIVKVIELNIEKYKPNFVYTHYAHDVNIDHQKISQAVVTACRPLPKSCVKSILFFEVPSSTEWQSPAIAQTFSPNWFVDISKFLDMKLKALMTYESEMRAWPHPRSIEAVKFLAKWRGASIGCDASEAFVLGRHFVDF